MVRTYCFTKQLMFLVLLGFDLLLCLYFISICDSHLTLIYFIFMTFLPLLKEHLFYRHLRTTASGPDKLSLNIVK